MPPEGGPLRRLLAPQRVAIVGLSSDPSKHGARVAGHLRRLGFAGEVWGVNPKLPDVPGVEVFPSVADLPDAPDVVVCAVPAPVVPRVVREAGAAGAAVAVVFAGGFAETGGAGGRLQEDLVAAARESGVRVLGPNSGGVIRPATGLALSFLTCLDRPPAEIRSGPVGLVTQSGGTGSYLHNLAAARGGGLAMSISTGNEADLGVADGISALLDMEEVRAVALVLETVRDGPAFLAALRRAREARVPVVACRLGRSERGRRLMQTHTAALAGPVRVLDGVLDALGVTVAETPGEMLEVAEVLARAPAPAGERMGVVTHSGGVAILLSDLADQAGLALPAPGRRLGEALAPLLDQGAVDNPLDMGGIIGGPHRFAEVVEAFLSSEDYDGVLAVSTAHPPAHTRERVASLLRVRGDKPLVHLWMAGDLGAEGLGMLRADDAPVTEEPRAAMRALAALGRLSQAEGGEDGYADTADLDPDALPAGAEPVSESQAKELLRRWGFPVVEGDLAASPERASRIADRLGFPVVVKVSSPDLPHKAEVDGIRLGLRDPDAVEQAFLEVTEAARLAAPHARIEGALVERHRPGVEVILGAVRDDTFGPVVLLGLGGAQVEALDDVVVAPAPVDRRIAERMISRLRGLRLLTHPRVGPPADLEGLAELASRLSRLLAVRADRLGEVEINPLIWSEDGWLAVDAVVRPPEAGA